ncbi:hypothetical protein PHMEG_0009801 [Phytophthora megakarya]|uniref:Uncharacterized protein n=1 Tax=Phytophthora megakarya TaxID=4795 RepID=A0A225WF99_9STRA|nr:hypothetical protein PHMEG_0009801 [Phytophthora megakarya]
MFSPDPNCEAEMTSAVMDAAARSGHVGVVEWLHSSSYAGCTTSMDDAAKNGYLNAVDSTVDGYFQ